jgi:hypothetical protein
MNRKKFKFFINTDTYFSTLLCLLIGFRLIYLKFLTLWSGRLQRVFEILRAFTDFHPSLEGSFEASVLLLRLLWSV